VLLVKNDDMIQAIPADGSDPAFNERILPRRARCCEDILNAQILDPSSDDLTVDAISVS